VVEAELKQNLRLDRAQKGGPYFSKAELISANGSTKLQRNIDGSDYHNIDSAQ